LRLGEDLAHLGQHIFDRRNAAGPHVRDGFPQGFHPLGPLGPFEQLLKGRSVLYHQLGLAVDGQDDGVFRLKFESESMSRLRSSMAMAP
jgi:hypothetical protein